MYTVLLLAVVGMILFTITKVRNANAKHRKDAIVALYKSVHESPLYRIVASGSPPRSSGKYRLEKTPITLENEHLGLEYFPGREDQAEKITFQPDSKVITVMRLNDKIQWGWSSINTDTEEFDLLDKIFNRVKSAAGVG
jgi:hypothetical protein